MADDIVAFSPEICSCSGPGMDLLPGADPDVMRLRPLSGSEEDVQKLAPHLESSRSSPPALHHRMALPSVQAKRRCSSKTPCGCRCAVAQGPFGE